MLNCWVSLARIVCSLDILVEARIGTTMARICRHSGTVSGVDVSRIRRHVMVRFHSVTDVTCVVRAGVGRRTTAAAGWSRVAAEVLGRVGKWVLEADGVLGRWRRRRWSVELRMMVIGMIKLLLCLWRLLGTWTATCRCSITDKMCIS